MSHRDTTPINRNFKRTNSSNNAMYIKARFALIESFNIILYIPLTKYRDTLQYIIEKYFTKPYLLSFICLCIHKAKYKSEIESVLYNYFAFHNQQRKNTYSYFIILLCRFYFVTVFVQNIVPFCST